MIVDSTRGSSSVTVEVSCEVRLADLTDLSLPGRITVTARASAPVHVYRGDG